MNLQNYTNKAYTMILDNSINILKTSKNIIDNIDMDNLKIHIPMIVIGMYVLVLSMAIYRYRSKYQNTKTELSLVERSYKEQSVSISKLTKLVSEINKQFNDSITFYIDELDKYRTIIRNRDLEIVQLNGYIDEIRNTDKSVLNNMITNVMDNMPLKGSVDAKQAIYNLAKHLGIEISVPEMRTRKQPFRAAAPKSFQLKEESESESI